MTAWYNEIDNYAADWLENLIDAGHIAKGVVDRRDIRLVQASDLAGYDQCHFFAGIGGWSYALRLAGWPDDRPVWTGSCPCQPFSLAGARKGFDDERHLWPHWSRLIGERRPAVVFGEQVASAAEWLRLVRGDLEALGYAVGAIPIEAASAGADHARDRFWFVADFNREAKLVRAKYAEVAPPSESLTNTDGTRFPRWSQTGADGQDAGDITTWDRPRDDITRIISRQHWPHQPVVGGELHGIPGRVAKLRAFGNAIVPQVAAEFIAAYQSAIT